MTTSAEQYLFWLQKVTWERLGIESPSQEQMVQVTQRVHKHQKKIGWKPEEIEALEGFPMADPSMPYEHPGDRSLVGKAVNAVMESVRAEPQYEESKKDCAQISFGTLPIGDVNGRVILVPRSDEYLAVFNNGVFRFTYLMGKVVAQALEYEDRGKSFAIPACPIDEIIVDRPWIVRRFRHVVGSYIVSGHPGFSRPYVTGPGPSYLASRFAKCQIAFLVGHEFGHVIQGHLSPSNAKKSHIRGQDVSEIRFNHQKEYDADFIGLDLLARSMTSQKQPLPLIEWAPIVLFLGLHVVRNAFEVLMTGSEQPDPESTTHPATPQRLIAMLAPLFDEKSEIPAERRHRANWMFSLIHRLWQETLPFFESGHAHRIAPAAVWLDEQLAVRRGRKAAVFNDPRRLGFSEVDVLEDGRQAIQVGDWVWLAGDRHGASAAWHRAAELGEGQAIVRLDRTASFDPSLPDETVFETGVS